MSIPRQLILPLRGSSRFWPFPRQVLRRPDFTQFTASATAQPNVDRLGSRLPSGGFIHSNGHAYFSWSADWTNLLQLPAKTKSRARRRRKPPKMPKGGDIVEEVVDEESFSPTISIITVRTTAPDSSWHNTEFKARCWRREWKNRIWTLQVSDYTKRFPRIFGNVSTYTPLPPLDDQNPGYLRLLVHRQENDDIATDAGNEKASKRGALIRMAQSGWRGYFVPLPKDVQQFVLLASGVTGIAPMLQTIHTILEARRGDDIDVGSRRPNIQFKQNPERSDVSSMVPFSTASLEDSAAEQIACSELEKLRAVHSDDLFIETIDAGGSAAQVAKVVEMAPPQRRKSSLLQRLHEWAREPTVITGTPWSPWGLYPFKSGIDGRVLFIMGCKGFAESLTSNNDSQSFTAEGGPSILAKAKQGGWRVMDLSTMKVCN